MEENDSMREPQPHSFCNATQFFLGSRDYPAESMRRLNGLESVVRKLQEKLEEQADKGGREDCRICAAWGLQELAALQNIPEECLRIDCTHWRLAAVVSLMLCKILCPV